MRRSTTLSDTDGSTFRTLLAEARQELGRLLLVDPAMEIDEIACLLGYQDTSSFYRGVREWEGVTPSRGHDIERVQVSITITWAG